MKRVLFVVALVCATCFSYAERVTKTDTFNDGISKFGIDAMADKKSKHYVTLDGEHLVIKSKKGNFYYGTKFPMSFRENFEVTFNLIFPKFDKDHVGGIVYNYKEDPDLGTGSGEAIVVSENKVLFYSESGKLTHSEKIKLKKGKNVKVAVTITKRGRKVSASVNGVDLENLDIEFVNSAMGFYVAEDVTLMVDDIKIIQEYRDED